MVNKKLAMVGLSLGILLVIIAAGVVGATGGKLEELSCFSYPYPLADEYPSPACSFFPVTYRPTGNQVILSETFTQGFSANYPWQHTNNAWAVNNDRLHNDGAKTDASGRYFTWHTINNINKTATGNLVLSFQGRLKSGGNPQEGRGITFGLVDDQGRSYELRMENGFTDGGAVNPAISLVLNQGGTLTQVIVVPGIPNRDSTYTVKVERQAGTWTLYINGAEAGSAADTFASTKFDKIVLTTIGSVIVDNGFISAK